jgi:hypothetical protein
MFLRVNSKCAHQVRPPLLATVDGRDRCAERPRDRRHRLGRPEEMVGARAGELISLPQGCGRFDVRRTHN